MNLYKKIANKFPPKIAYCVAYGSGVKQQLGYDNLEKKTKMIDFVFCVRNTKEWHSKNLLLHPNHYSGLKFFGNNFITNFQHNYGANVYCNTLIDLDDLNLQIKYNVISVDDFICDLNNWNHLYMAGRMHKPVSEVLNDGGKELELAKQRNLIAALRVALLMLPSKFTSYELFYKISEISYKGDFRMVFGENKNKVHNIVSPQIKEFCELYEVALNELSFCVTQLKSDSDKSVFEQDKSRLCINTHLMKLPSNLNNEIIDNFKKLNLNNVQNKMDYSKITKPEEIMEIISLNENSCKILICKSIDKIVWRSSITQSIKNVPTAGILKSLFYSWRKALKTFN